MSFAINYRCLIALSLTLSSCSNHSNKSVYGTNEKNFQNKRPPIENSFIQNGGYKVKIPNNTFVSAQEAVEVYNKDGKNSLIDVPATPKELSTNPAQASGPMINNANPTQAGVSMIN